MIDYYNKTSNDVLVRVPIPQTGEIKFLLMSMHPSKTKVWNCLSYWITNTGIINYSIGANVSTLKSSSQPKWRWTNFRWIWLVWWSYNQDRSPMDLLWALSFCMNPWEYFQSQEEIDQAHIRQKILDPRHRFKDVNGDNKIDQNDRTHVGSPFSQVDLWIKSLSIGRILMYRPLFRGYGNDLYFLYGNFCLWNTESGL